MIAAVSRFAAAALTLVAFGFIVWFYMFWGRALLGINGNMELLVVGIALWTVRGYVGSGCDELIKVIEQAANNEKAKRWVMIGAGVMVAIAAALFIVKTLNVI